ncbi:ABC transporter permease [candidate division GN15 bacterium]|uniref:ABC transporter permease n=1 Tax=candidate division GN15 bacterium TaxID=2072418 RepID=A0A855X4B3_9BACT|nr:MAG: ABC transporter permease [candidate division GN15 bacterium]
MWRQFVGVIRKEFTQARRDRNTLRMLFVLPLVQIIVLGYAVNTDVKLLQVDVYDADRSEASRQLVTQLGAGDYFIPVDRALNGSNVPLWRLEERFREGDAQMALIIPRDFARDLQLRRPVKIGWITDGTDANAGRTGTGYASQIIQRFSNDAVGLHPNVEFRSQFMFNPEAESVFFMVPGIVATLLTMLTLMMTSMSIVREREMGTLEQVLVTPISSVTLLFGKIVAFVITAMLVMAIALAAGVFWFDVPFVGSLPLMVVLTLLYLLSTLGLGMFISTITHTQQQAMFLAWFFSIFTMLTSGYLTPIANMPVWLQYVTMVNPMRFYIEIVRGIMLKGSNLWDLYENVVALAIFGTLIFSFALLRFHKRTT